jgi:hypothetical protein
MYPDEVKVDHCYSMTVNGRRIVARVTKFFEMNTRVGPSEDVKNGSTESPTMKSTVVRFVWRHAAYTSGWSAGSSAKRTCIATLSSLISGTAIASGLASMIPTALRLL